MVVYVSIYYMLGVEMKHIATFATHGKPTRWLQVIDLCTLGRTIGAPLEHIAVIQLSKGSPLTFAGGMKGAFFVVCVEGEVMLRQDPVTGSPGSLGGSLLLSLDEQPHRALNAAAQVEASRELVMTGAGTALVLSEAPIFERDAIAAFVVYEVMLRFDFNIPECVYVVHMEPGGTPAGNHWHALRHELFYALSGSMEVGLVDVLVPDDPTLHELNAGSPFETRYMHIPPSTAHAVRNMSQQRNAKLMVISTDTPRVDDDYPLIVLES